MQPGHVIRNASPSPHANRILAALSRKASRSFFAGVTRVELPLGQVLCEARTASRHVYFPNNCMVSLLAVAERGSGLEVGLVGSEGMVGVSLALGAVTSPVKALVQGAGGAMRMSAVRFRRELEHNRPLQRSIERCANAAMATAMQIAVCNKEHRLEARLARWLLMTQDRAHSNAFHITHEFLALMLGVRRAGVTRAATSLQKLRLIDYSRGNIVILDRPGLKAASCACYGADRETYRRTLNNRMD